MLLGVKLVKTVPLQYKFQPTSPRDADTANTLFLVVYSVHAVCEPFGPNGFQGVITKRILEENNGR